jgi:hypothetical protein
MGNKGGVSTLVSNETKRLCTPFGETCLLNRMSSPFLPAVDSGDLFFLCRKPDRRCSNLMKAYFAGRFSAD